MLGGTVLALPSCSDTWDDHYTPGGGDNTAATETLWDIISSKPELSRFKEIAEKTTYYRDEMHPQNNYTFKDILQSPMQVTVWAPENDAFTDAEFTKWQNLLESNNYTVHQQLLGNTVTMWRQVATGAGIDTLTMLNGKKAAFDKQQFTIQGLSLNDKNIAASNGTLHTLKTILPFKFNIYEYLKDEENATANSVMLFHDYIAAYDTTYFDKNSSIEGNPDADGNPTYVDSVYITSNSLFRGTHRFPKDENTEQYEMYDECFGANIIAEDSTFIAILPTDNAWNQAIQKLKPYYNYAAKYADKVELNKSSNSSTVSPRTISNVDSLQEKSILMDIISPLCFNLHFQPNGSGNIGRWQLDDFMANNSKAEYFLNTFGDTIRSNTDGTWDKSEMLKGRQVSVSNGVAIVADEWNVPAKLYKPDVIVEINGNTIYNPNIKGTYVNRPFSNEAAAAWVDSTGRVTENNFFYVAPAIAGGDPVIEFKLVGTHGENYESEVMSGKYDVYAVMVPNFYQTSTDSIEGDTLKHKFVATMYYCNGAATGRDANKKSGTVEYLGEKVQEILLFEDFEFPYSYKNLLHSYPTLQLTTKTTGTERKTGGYSNDFCIDRIILRSKD